MTHGRAMSNSGDHPEASGLYCTYFDSAYLPRGRTLIDSLRRQSDDRPIYVLALDDSTYSEVTSWALHNVNAIALSELEESFPELTPVKHDRTGMDYIFTLTPYVILYVMTFANEKAWVTYLDADMAFFSSTQPIYTQLESASVGVVAHRFTWDQKWRERYGRFNVGWVSFRQDMNGRECLEWWADQCLQWCHDKVNEGRFADQGYLDDFSKRFQNIKVIDIAGANLAPWNLRGHNVTLDQSGQVLVDRKPLIFFHFHGLKVKGSRFYFKHASYLAKTTNTIRDHIYHPYCSALMKNAKAHGSLSNPMDREISVMAFMSTKRAELLRGIANLRGDFLDIE